MKRRVVLGNVTGSLILAAAMMSSAMAEPAGRASSVADTWWSYHGDVEVGGRFFTNNPTKNGIASQNQSSLGKYYEYSTIKPGAFVNGWLNAGTKDGLYQVDVWGDNVGYSDQRIELGASKAGEFYFTGSWDETPHIYSTNALTLYSGLGTGALTLPAGLSNKLFLDAGCVRVPGAQPLLGSCGAGNPTAAQVAAIQRDINNNLYVTDIGIRRDTAAVAFRWTPTDAWDVNVDYSHMHRHGTQVEGVVFSPGTSGVVAQVPKPVDDTTQNFGINGEYKGTSPWNKPFTFKLAYGGSVFQEERQSYTVENPFCATGSGPGECARNGSPSSPLALMTLWPDNQAHGFSATTGLDLPMQSRYMGTVSYTMMRQNQAFEFNTNRIFTVGNTTLGAPTPPPASSLNGSIDTFLSNNVLTTQITPTLKSKFTYRYYDLANKTPELLFNDWTVTDVKGANTTTANYAPVSSLSISYTKQNIGADLVWSPTRQWNIGGGYGYEQYKWTRADADKTHENSGKAFVDYKPWSWLMARASWVVSDRRYDTYDYRGFVGNAQWTDPLCQTPAGGCSTQYNVAMRQFYLDNRQRNVGKFSLAIDLFHNLTLTPTFGYQDDNYALNAPEQGLRRSQSIKSGVELAYAVSPGTSLMFAYMDEQYRQNLSFTTANGSLPVTSANTWHADVKDNVKTFMGAVNWAAIPEKLDLRVSYTMSLSNSGNQPFIADNGVGPLPGSGATGTGGQFPDVKGQWSRLEAMAKYTFDKDAIRVMGINGQAYAKLRYVWERNSVNNYDQDIMQSYMNPLINNTGFMTWMAYNNPNYNTHLIGASLGLKW